MTGISTLCSICSSLCKATGSYLELFNLSNIDQLSPETCSICGIIQLLSGDYQRPIGKISSVACSENSTHIYIDLNFLDARIGNSGRLCKIYKPDTDQISWTRNLSKNTLCEASISFLKAKFTECTNKHSTCGRSEAARPTRLLRIESPTCSKIFLEESSQNTPDPYFTLSHCWGGVQPYTLTSDSEALLRAGLDIQCLPKTFRDAIHVCQQFSVHYLWIDSLCIFQDRLADWEKEAGNMHTVYAGATCNIAATDALDSSIGMSFDRNVLAYQPFWVHKGNGKDSYIATYIRGQKPVDISPLNRRAWVMQERFLSRRIMHFTKDGVYWECLEDMANDVFPMSTLSHSSSGLSTREYQQLRTNIHSRHQFQFGASDEFYRTWLDIIGHYTRGKLTRDTDKLVAIDGIAQKIGSLSGARMVWGLWEHLILHELLWMVSWSTETTVMQGKKWRAPTWSWASSNTGIENIFSRRHSRCSMKQDLASARIINTGNCTTGRPTDSTLAIRGKPLRVTVIVEGAGSGKPPRLVGNHGSIDGSFRALQMDGRCKASPFSEQLTLVAITKCQCRGDNALAMALLILRKLDTNPTTYNRVGFLQLERNPEMEFIYANEPAEEEELFVV